MFKVNSEVIKIATGNPGCKWSQELLGVAAGLSPRNREI